MRHMITSVEFSPDGERIVSGGLDQTVRLWSAKTASEIGMPMQHQGKVLCVAFSPDGEIVASGGSDKNVRLWNGRTGVAIRKPLPHSHEVHRVAFNPAGTLIVSGAGNTVRLWDIGTCELAGEPMHHSEQVMQITFSPDGKRIASSSDDKTLRVWEVSSCMPIGESMKHSKNVYSFGFSRDGSRLVSKDEASDSMKMWDVMTGVSLGVPMKDRSIFAKPAFTMDNTGLVSPDNNGYIKIYDVSELSFNRVPRETLNRALTLWSGFDSETGRKVRALSSKELDDIRQQFAQDEPLSAFLRYQQSRQLPAFHRMEAETAEISQNWFAARFHLQRLISSHLPGDKQGQTRLAARFEHAKLQLTGDDPNERLILDWEFIFAQNKRLIPDLMVQRVKRLLAYAALNPDHVPLAVREKWSGKHLPTELLRESIVTSDRLRSYGPDEWSEVYGSGRCYSLCLKGLESFDVPEKDAMKAELRMKALAVLNVLAAKGFKLHIELDSAFEPLLGLPEFEAVLKKLRTK
jgi:hypothetical protein